ncbi:hypothetical protein WBP07_22715 (plasmid) [Novosphingobium sp. BL-8A]|uniref:hypothetical protein n=1 Tax=Novosphingobium sp. BL-8A TaxID=3127639 RepID=UPI003757196C
MRRQGDSLEIGQSCGDECRIPNQIEPARIDALTGDLPDLVAEIAAKAEALGRAFHPQTALHLASLVRLMNSYYSNLIEGHRTRPRDIERALAGERDDDQRDLTTEAAAHYRVQGSIDLAAADGELPDPADPEFIRQLLLCQRIRGDTHRARGRAGLSHDPG